MLKIKDLVAGYGDVRVLNEVSLEINNGEIVSIVGANAAGKTTLVNAISGLVQTSSGEILFEGESIEQLNPKDRVELGIIEIPEGRLLFPDMTVEDNLMMGGFSPRTRKNVAKNMEMVFSLYPILRERRKQLGGSLSGGEQQMCAIGRGLMGEPKLLMLDEPSLGLAPIVVQRLMATIRQISDEMGTTILLVEQNVKHALSMAKRAYVLENGHIVLSGSGQELMGNEHVKKAYMGL